MSKNNNEIQKRIRRISEEHVLFLSSQQNMQPGDIIKQYTGVDTVNASLTDAVESVEKFNTEAVKKYGFLPC